MKIAVLSPHRGDAALGLGLAIAAWLRQGHSVEGIVCCTRTEEAPFSDVGSLHAHDRMSFASAVRQREDAAWLKLVERMLRQEQGTAKPEPEPARPGRLSLTELTLKEAALRLHVPAQQAFGMAVPAEDKALAKIRRALERSSAHAWVLPLALDAHVDRRAARNAALTIDDPGTVAVAFYEELPQAAHLGEPGVAAAVAALPVPVQAWFADTAAENEGVLAERVARKRRMALCYDSVLNDADVEQVAQSGAAFAGRERLWATDGWRKAFGNAGEPGS